MNPGRELDVLVAEKVMGINPKDLVQIPGDWKVKFLGCPAYSTDIAAAWEVVEKLQPLSGRHFIIQKCGVWLAQFWDGTLMSGETAPHAICMAALETVTGIDKSQIRQELEKMTRLTLKRETDIRWANDLEQSDMLTDLLTEIDALRAELIFKNGTQITGYCIRCEELASKYSQLEDENKVLKETSITALITFIEKVMKEQGTFQAYFFDQKEKIRQLNEAIDEMSDTISRLTLEQNNRKKYYK